LDETGRRRTPRVYFTLLNRARCWSFIIFGCGNHCIPEVSHLKCNIKGSISGADAAPHWLLNIYKEVMPFDN
jgi:hypothetical protein